MFLIIALLLKLFLRHILFCYSGVLNNIEEDGFLVNGAVLSPLERLPRERGQRLQRDQGRGRLLGRDTGMTC